MKARVYFDDGTSRDFLAEEPLRPSYKFPISIDFFSLIEGRPDRAISKHKQAMLSGIVDGIAIYIEEPYGEPYYKRRNPGSQNFERETQGTGGAEE